MARNMCRKAHKTRNWFTDSISYLEDFSLFLRPLIPGISRKTIFQLLVLVPFLFLWQTLPTKSNWETIWFILDYSFRVKVSILLEREYQKFEPDPQSGSREITCHLYIEHREQGKGPGEKHTSFSKALPPGVFIALPYIVVIWRPNVHTNEPMRAHFSLKSPIMQRFKYHLHCSCTQLFCVHNLDHPCFIFLP